MSGRNGQRCLLLLGAATVAVSSRAWAESPVDPGLDDRLPRGAYFATRYRDGKRQLETWIVHYEDGHVEAYDGRRWWLKCRLSPRQVRWVKRAILRSGIRRASNLGRGRAFDTATVWYMWRVGRSRGRVYNAAYPAREHPAMRRLDARVDPYLEKICPEPPAGKAHGPDKADLRGWGLLSVTSSPYAQVVVDGKALGFTPRIRARLAAGDHRLCLVRKDLKLRWCSTISIERGKHFRVIRKLASRETR